MDKDNSAEIEKEEEEYEVEKIVGHTVNKTKKNKKFVYNIKWLNYDDSENTWEKEDNVYALDMIAQYWSKFPKSNEDRKTFELMQSKKKNPIRLSSPPPLKVAKVITVSSPSPPASPTLQPSSVDELELVTTTTTTLPEAPKPTVVEATKITTSIANFFSFAKKDPRVSSTVASTSSTSSTSTTNATVPVEPQQSKINDIYKSAEPTSTTIITATRKGKKKEGFTVPKVIDRTAADNDNFTPASVDSSSSSDSDEDENRKHDQKEGEYIEITNAKDIVQLSSSSSSEEEEEEPAKRETKLANRKRTRSTYTDYFTEQHKKRRMEEGNTRRRIPVDDDDDDEDEEDEIESVSSSIDDDKVKETEDDAIVFDEAFGKDPDMDWDTLAQKVEYIGRELEKSPIYCAVRWKDGERSIHSLKLVRKKRPDLVIDALLTLVYP